MTNEEIRRAVNKALNLGEWGGVCVNGAELGDYITIELREYEAPSLNFGALMAVAQALGTLDFDINDEFEEGHWYSEYTKDSDTYIRRFVVHKDKLGAGLPWEARHVGQ